MKLLNFIEYIFSSLDGCILSNLHVNIDIFYQGKTCVMYVMYDCENCVMYDSNTKIVRYSETSEFHRIRFPIIGWVHFKVFTSEYRYILSEINKWCHV